MEPEKPALDNGSSRSQFLAGFRERTLKLFSELKDNKQFQEQFSHNPAAILSEKLIGRPISLQKASVSNRALFDEGQPEVSRLAQRIQPAKAAEGNAKRSFVAVSRGYRGARRSSPLSADKSIRSQ